MISFEEARQIVLQNALQLGTRNLGFCDALGYVLGGTEVYRKPWLCPFCE